MTIRIANPQSDFPKIAELLTNYGTETITVSDLWDDENRMFPGKIRRRWVHLNSKTDEINGYAMIIKYPSEPAHLFHLELVVNPAFSRQGIGNALYEIASIFAQEHHCGRLMTSIKDADSSSLSFAQKRGFAISHHVFDSVLDIQTFDDSHFSDVIPTLEAQGIRFITLSQTGMDDASIQALYQLNRAAMLEEPGSTGGFPVYENWQKIVLESSWYRPESQFIAIANNQFIGLAGIYNEPDTPEEMFNGFTGVNSNYRGRKIALALKLLTIRYAREHNAKIVKTENDVRNAPMLAINQKLGYQALAGHYVMTKNF